ncbi:MAG: DUF1413 domain-containing protein [Clostridia bacterium]|nr:DUF1413 domain-containing protein [Clostridia bacterium]MBQ9130833.1 DUF1413 domain-containing protein [Clostridia bacterium]
MNVELWLNRARLRIESSLKDGTMFELKSLFPPHEWEELSKGERIALGRCFSMAVKDGEIEQVERVENGKSRHNRYVKLK